MHFWVKIFKKVPTNAMQKLFAKDGFILQVFRRAGKQQPGHP